MKDSFVSIFFSKEKRQQNLLLLCCSLIFVGFVGARALISISLVGIVLLALFSQNIATTFRNYRKQPLLWLPSIFFFVLLFSGINSEDKNLWWLWVKIKIPFLLLPFAFAAFTRLSLETFYKLLYVFSNIVFFSACFVLANYLFHLEVINALILKGGAVPVPYSHIRYSLLLVFALFTFLWLAEKQFYFVSIQEIYFQYGAAVFLFIVLHILAVRSGLLALYLCLLFYVIRFLWLKKSWVVFIGSILVLVVSIFTAIKCVPSLSNKISYTKYDLADFSKGNIDDHSDGMRLASLMVGVELIKENFWIGTGAGDILAESKKMCERKFPQIQNDLNRKMPHNEFLWIFAATGIFGFVAFCIAFLVPFFVGLSHKNWLFVVLHLIYLSSFLSEYSLEEQIGSMFYLIFLLLFLQHFQQLKKEDA